MSEQKLVTKAELVSLIEHDAVRELNLKPWGRGWILFIRRFDTERWLQMHDVKEPRVFLNTDTAVRFAYGLRCPHLRISLVTLPNLTKQKRERF
jgi:hypothetical protein